MIHPERKFIENAERKNNRITEHKQNITEAKEWLKCHVFLLSNNQVHYGTYQKKIYSTPDRAMSPFVGVGQHDGRALEGECGRRKQHTDAVN